ncbi:MAG: NADH-quinone oxidoreductase subunit C [Thermodesulfobacteriota bacterium]
MQEPIFCKKLKDEFPQYIKEIYESFGLHTAVINRNGIVEVCRFLKNDPESKFNYLTDICGVDYLPEKPRFMVVYHLYSISFKHRLRLKYGVDEGEDVQSVTGIWKTANWHEREAYDMYGITFKGHPDLRRIYMWDDFEGYPLRKDFPLRGYKDEYNPFGEEKD